MKWVIKSCTRIISSPASAPPPDLGPSMQTPHRFRTPICVCRSHERTPALLLNIRTLCINREHQTLLSCSSCSCLQSAASHLVAHAERLSVQDERLSVQPANKRLLCLLCLLGLLCQLPLTSCLGSLWASLGIKTVIPPSEAASIVADEALVVDIVMLGAGPDGEEVVEGPWEVVSGVRIDGLEETEDDPEVHGDDVQVAGDGAPHDGAEDCAGAEDHDFNWRGVFGCEAEGGRVLVVDLVDAAIERAPVHGAMRPVMPGVLDDEEDGDVKGHLPEGGKRDASIHAEVDSHWVEDPDLWEFDGEVGEEDELRAVPLFLESWDFVLVVSSAW